LLAALTMKSARSFQVQSRDGHKGTVT